MKKLKPAWIGYRDRVNPNHDPWPYLEKYAKMGFKAMDGDLSMFPGDLKENLKRYRDLGLESLCTGIGSTHGEFHKDPANLKAVVEKANLYGVKKVNLRWTQVIRSFRTKIYGDVGTYDEMMQDIDDLNKTVKLLADEGLIPMYHNHYQEFTTVFKGISVMDYYLVLIDPRLCFKLDVGWVYSAGLDPVTYMEKVKDRIALLHCKDMLDPISPRYMQDEERVKNFGFTALGTGKLDLPGIFRKALEIGQDWIISEQDRMNNLSWEESMQLGIFNMRETGLVE
ncbi:MAG: sugar phosphate isomerase/epimerase [Treponema sp.]|nr:sugar phosphate isomerase/epimerase [Treponema sp.]